jgi:hypothetical protein
MTLLIVFGLYCLLSIILGIAFAGREKLEYPTLSGVLFATLWPLLVVAKLIFKAIE